MGGETKKEVEEEVSKMTDELSSKMESAKLEDKGEGDSTEAPTASGDSIYTSETRGSDEAGEGSYKVPYKTILQAMRRSGKEPFPVIYQDAKAESEASKAGQLYEIVAKAQIKKQTKMWAQEAKKLE